MPEENKVVCLPGGGLFTLRKPGRGDCGQNQKVGDDADAEKSFSNGDRFRVGFQAHLLLTYAFRAFGFHVRHYRGRSYLQSACPEKQGK